MSKTKVRETKILCYSPALMPISFIYCEDDNKSIYYSELNLF